MEGLRRGGGQRPEVKSHFRERQSRVRECCPKRTEDLVAECGLEPRLGFPLVWGTFEGLGEVTPLSGHSQCQCGGVGGG